MSGYRALHEETTFRGSTTSSLELLQYGSTQITPASTGGGNVDGTSRPAAKIRPFVKPGVLEIWFRSMGLSMLWNACRRASHGPRTEDPKQAMNKGLLVAVFSLVAAHLGPVSVALALVILNIHGYYIGGELAGPVGHDDVKLSGLQFAAKLHEITMQGSLSVIVVGLIRQELVAGEGIPFGAIFGSLQFSDISYLYSKEFAGTLQAKFAKGIVKLRLITLLVVGALLSLTVGPSSAIAMRPRVDNWPAGGTDFYLNATVEEIWPSRINASAIPISCRNITADTTCISRDWESTIYQLLAYWPKMTETATMPEILQYNSPKSIRLMYTRQTQGLYPFFETVATTQMSNLADALAENGRLWAIAANQLRYVSPRKPRKFRYRNNAIYSITGARQPITTAVCQVQHDISLLRESDAVEFPVAASLCNETRLASPYRIQSGQSAMITAFLEGSTITPDLQFVELPPESFGNNTIGALITFPPSWPGGSNLLTCTVDARWILAPMQSSRNIMKVVSGQPPDWPGHGVCNSTSPSIKVTAEWAQYLNPHVQDTNKTVFHTLVEGAGMRVSASEDDSGFVQSVIESILTTTVTNGLSRTASSATIQGELNDCPNNDCNETCGLWCLDIMPKPSREFGYGGNIYNLSRVLDLPQLSKFTVQVDVTGYAYNIRGATMILSCMVLLSYSVLVGVHSAFVLMTRSSSKAWDSVSEFMALAIQSQPTKVLKNTCAGISSTKVFSNLVRVVVRPGIEYDHLELDFGDQSSGYAQKLEKDEFYG